MSKETESKPSQRRKYVAHHEAGHAVAALVAYRALGWPASLLREATAIADGAIYGQVSWLHTYSPQSASVVKAFAANPEIVAGLIPKCKWAIVVSLAGIEADARLSRVSGGFAAMRGGASDYEDAYRALADLAIMTNGTPTLDGFERLASSIVRSELQAIRAVAEAMHRRGTMTGGELEAIAAPLLSGIVHKVADL